MTKVSRRILNKELEQYIFELFIKTIVDLKTSIDVANFINDLLSPTEKIMLIKRLAIAILLTKGYTYDAIDETLKVSRPTINHVSYWLKHGNSGYQKVVEKIITTQKTEAFWDRLEELLLKLSRPGMVGSLRFEKRQKAGKELYKRKKMRSEL